MSEKGDRCFRCENFDRYYLKGVKHYKAVPFGWCCKKVCTVGSKESCEFFRAKASREILPWQLRLCLNDVLTELSEIRKILEADGDGADQDEEV